MKLKYKFALLDSCPNEKFLYFQIALSLLINFFLFAPKISCAELTLADSSIPKGRIVFSYTSFDRSSGGAADIYVLDLEKKSIHPLVTSIGKDEYPNWSSDGTKVVFQSDMSGSREVYVVDSDGENLKRLTKGAGVNENPSWSPDSQKIVFVSNRLPGKKENSTNLFIMNSDGSSPQALTGSNYQNSVPQWSPRGDEILFTTSAAFPGWDIGLYHTKTKKIEILTEGRLSFCRPAWNSDGSMFVFSYGGGDDVDVWIQKKGETKPTQLTSLPGREYDALWSDDETKIFFVGEQTKGRGDFQLYFIDMRTEKVSVLLKGDGSVRHPSWTPFAALPARSPN